MSNNTDKQIIIFYDKSDFLYIDKEGAILYLLLRW